MVRFQSCRFKYLAIVIVALLIGLAVGYFARSQRPWSMGDSHFGDASMQAESMMVQMFYTCGMHPEVISEEPGDCPKCGMTLTPMAPDRARTILEARGEWVDKTPTGANGQERKILYWRAPMDPAYIRKEAGKSPMGMDLVPVYEDDVAGGPTIRIDPVTEQNMGVRYAVVRQGPLEKTVRAVGLVDFDEKGLTVATTRIDGWVREVHVDVTGQSVESGDPLFTIDSPELFSAQQEYLTALADSETAQKSGRGVSLRLAKERLKAAGERLQYFDIDEVQIEELRKTKIVSKTLTIRARSAGVVIELAIKEGDFLKAGQPAYRIADLSSVWVMGKVYESDLPYVKAGQKAEMTLDYLPGRAFDGEVQFVYPYLEKGTREIPVRFEFPNADMALKPGMYATVKINSRIAESAILVPSMAVIMTGQRQVAFVMREAGKFEPRAVETGLRTASGELQVLSGLAPGEKVVVSGQFMLDSESRLREATLKMLNPGLVDANNANEKESEVDGEAHQGMPGMDPAATADSDNLDLYTCPMPSHAHVVSDLPGDCEECGMKLVPTGEVDHGLEAEDHFRNKH